MPILKEAWASLKRNQPPVYAYVLVTMLFISISSGVDWAVTAWTNQDSPPAWLGLYNAARQVALSALVAGLQACVFAILGREMDKPLWKCEGARAALRRFFLPWFLINLLAYLVIMVEVRAVAAGLDGVVVLVELLFMLLFILAVPMGACVMFWGRFRWPELGEALRPLVTQLRHTLAIALIGLFGYFLQAFFTELAYRGDMKPVIGPVLTVLPLTVIELLQFAATWHLCRLHRDSDPLTDSDPFDF